MTPRFNSRARNTHGQVMAQGVMLFIIMSIVLLGTMVILITIAQYTDISMKVSCAAKAGAQEALNSTQWTRTDLPVTQGGHFPNILAVVNTCLTEMGLRQIDMSQLSGGLPHTTGVSGEYEYTVSITYPVVPYFSALMPGSATISASASVSSGNQPHKLAWINVVPPIGDTFFPANSGSASKGGILVPVFGGGNSYSTGFVVGEFTQYTQNNIGVFGYRDQTGQFALDSSTGQPVPFRRVRYPETAQ